MHPAEYADPAYRATRTSPTKKGRQNVTAREVYSLPALQRFEPVLASSPRSYMVEGSRAPLAHCEDADEEICHENDADEDSTSEYDGCDIPSPTEAQQMKASTWRSPRVVRAPPPVGIAARGDVDIYRYSQTIDQRMAIRPLFEQRREAKAASQKYYEDQPTANDRDAIDEDSISLELEGGDLHEDVAGKQPDQQSSRVESETDGHYGGSEAQDMPPDDLVSITDDYSSAKDENSATAVFGDLDASSPKQTQESPSQKPLVPAMELATCYEPFLTTDAPRLSKLRSLIRAADKLPFNDQDFDVGACSTLGTEPDAPFYKTIWNDLRKFGDREVDVSIHLSSERALSITCSTDESMTIVGISEGDLARVRSDLVMFTPNWSRWIVSKLRYSELMGFYLALDDQSCSTDKERCFSSTIKDMADQAISIELFRIEAGTALIVQMSAVDSEHVHEFVLSADEARSLAATAGLLRNNHIDEEIVHALFYDPEFLSHVAGSNLVRLGLLMDEKAPETQEDSQSPQDSGSVCAEPLRRRVVSVDFDPQDPISDVDDLLQTSTWATSVALVARAHADNGIVTVLRELSRQEAVHIYSKSLLQPFEATEGNPVFRANVRRNLEAAKAQRLQDIAVSSIVDDLIDEISAFEARETLLKTKFDREKYLFYGFRPNPWLWTSFANDQTQYDALLREALVRRRQGFLMQVLTGFCVGESAQDVGVHCDTVREILNEYGIVIGCPRNIGDSVVEILHESSQPAAKLVSRSEISAALLLATRNNDSCATSTGRHPASDTPEQLTHSIDPDAKACPQQVLCAIQRLVRHAAGQKAAFFVAICFRKVLPDSLNDFNLCRELWEESVRVQEQLQRVLSSPDVDQLAHQRGIDPGLLFEALTPCVLHECGTAVAQLIEKEFDDDATRRNGSHLRDEISGGLEEFNKTLALWYLDGIDAVSARELLHAILTDSLHDEHIRHALPLVLSVANVAEKYELTRKLIHGYGGAAYGNAFNSVCWSCLDSTEASRFVDQLTRQPIEKDDADRPSVEDRPHAGRTVASRALFLLTGEQSVQFLQFLARATASTSDRSVRTRASALLAPYAARYELFRVAGTLCALDSRDTTSLLLSSNHFQADALRKCRAFWDRYRTLFGADAASIAIDSLPR